MNVRPKKAVGEKEQETAKTLQLLLATAPPKVKVYRSKAHRVGDLGDDDIFDFSGRTGDTCVKGEWCVVFILSCKVCVTVTV